MVIKAVQFFVKACQHDGCKNMYILCITVFPTSVNCQFQHDYSFLLKTGNYLSPVLSRLGSQLTRKFVSALPN